MQSPSAAHHHQRYLYGIFMAGIGSMLFSGKAVLVKLAFGYGANAETLLALRMLMALPLFWTVYWWEARRKPMSPITWIDRAKIFTLDTIGVGLAGGSTPEITPLLRAVQGWGDGQQVGLWGTRRKLSSARLFCLMPIKFIARSLTVYTKARCYMRWPLCCLYSLLRPSAEVVFQVKHF